MKNAIKKCPVCGSEELMSGEVATFQHKFVPGKAGLLDRFGDDGAVTCFVCLDCGFLGHCLSEKQLEQLRNDA